VKFLGIEDIATFQAFNILGVFVSGDNSNPWVFAGGNHRIGQDWIWKLLPQIVATFSTNSNGILVNLCLLRVLKGKGTHAFAGKTTPLAGGWLGVAVTAQGGVPPCPLTKFAHFIGFAGQ